MIALEIAGKPKIAVGQAWSRTQGRRPACGPSISRSFTRARADSNCR